MLRRLAEYFTAQQHFIQDLSHEFRTPLTILKGELEVTLKKLRSPEEYTQVLASSLEEIDQFQQISEWEKETETGDRAELSGMPEQSALW